MVGQESRTSLDTAGIADPDFRRLAEVVVGAMERLDVPGVALGLLHDGAEHVAGFGVTSVEAPVPVDTHTLFQIGSITKTFTGTAAMRLVEQGKLDLDVPVRTYLPDLKLRDEDAAARVTLRHLFNHTGGWLGDYFADTGLGDDALAIMVKQLADLPQWTPLGQLFSYNNAGFYIAGRVIEVVTGQTYEAAIKELIFDPLGLAESFFFANDCISRRVSVGHHVRDRKPAVARPWALPRGAHAAGAIVASVRDQLRYAQFQIGDGTAPDGTRLLSRASLDEMQSPATPAGSAAGAVGVTWMVKTLDGVKMLRHSGGTNGQLSVLVLVPERNFALSVLTNADPGGEICVEAMNWALRHYCDIGEADFVPGQFSEAELAPYSGHYAAALTEFDVTVRDGGLVLQAIPQGGFPDKSATPPPPPPPTRLAIAADETIIALDPPFKDARGEFLRAGDGALGWLRFGGRIARRQG
jgi:CubicO group peptidase (beta-lactamase class C family)